MAVTLEDVALKAGVSHTTVSLVLRGERKISEKTRAKVLSAIKKMNYHPNLNARSLANGRTNTIAIMASHYSSFFTMDLISGIEDGAVKTEYDLQQYSTRGNRERERRQVMEMIYGRRADGIILISMKPEPGVLKELKKTKMPVVFVERSIIGFSGVVSDNEKGAYAAAVRLIKSGRKNIGIVHGRLENNDCTNAAERYAGFVKALSDYGIAHEADNSMETWYTFEDGVKACREFMKKGTRPDAVFCAAGDPVALGFMKEAARLGIKVPDDIAVIGYDDMMASSMVSPALTTVRQPITDMGREALNLINKIMLNELNKPVVSVFEPELIIRESA